MDRQRQGDIGELSAMYWLASEGLPVYLPVGHSPHCDLVTELMGQPVRVQVKTSTQWRERRWVVTLCTKGGNRSWSGVVKRVDPELCEYVFVHVGDGRRWFVPANRLDGAYSVLLGGRKYAQFEIARGEPLLPRSGVFSRVIT
jgi:hypothetical protein